MCVFPPCTSKTPVTDSSYAQDAWLKLLKAHAAFCALEEPDFEFCEDCSSEDASLAEATWYRAMRGALAAWDPLDPTMPFLAIIHDMSGDLKEDGVLCDDCERLFDKHGHSFEHRYRDTAPDFPL